MTDTTTVTATLIATQPSRSTKYVDIKSARGYSRLWFSIVKRDLNNFNLTRTVKKYGETLRKSM